MSDAPLAHLILGADTQRRDRLRSFFEVRTVDQRPASAASLPIRPVNMFVGANNSGKSRMLRSIVAGHRQLVVSTSKEHFWRVASEFCSWYQTGGRFTSTGGQVANAEATDLYESVNKLFDASGDLIALEDTLVQLVNKAQRVERTLRNHGVTSAGASNERIGTWIHKLSGITSESAKPLTPSRAELLRRHCAYVPLLRYSGRFSIHVGSQADMLSRVAEQNLYVLRDPNNSKVVSGLSLYNDILSMATGNRDSRNRLSSFETLLSTEFFGGEPVSIVPRAGVTEDKHSIEIEIGKLPQRPLHELGEGLGAMVLLLGMYFVLPDESWVGIEEPEMGLHPSFQRRWLNAVLTSRAIRDRNITTWITTHSPTLLGMASERGDQVSVTWFSRDTTSTTEERFVFRQVQSEYFDAMQDLGLHNSSVLLANCMIWVEGPSDVIYLRALLGIHPEAQRHGLREDLDYAFFMYGGALLSHYALGEEPSSNASTQLRAVSLANRIVLVTDRDTDDSSSAKAKLREGLQEVASKVPNRFKALVTDGWEIENELGTAIWNKILSSRFSEVDPATVKIADEDRDIRLGTAIQNAATRWRARDGSSKSCEYTFTQAGSNKNGVTLSTSWKMKFARHFAQLANTGELKWLDLEATAAAKLTSELVDAIEKWRR